LILLFVVIVAGGIWIIHLENSITEYYSTSWVSESIKQAKSKNAFVCELQINPREVEFDKLKVEINECWIEKQMVLKHSWLWKEEFKPTGKYRLCLNLKNKLPNAIFKYSFVNKNGKSFALNSSGNVEVFNTFIEIDTLKSIKINIKNSYDKSLSENIILSLK